MFETSGGEGGGHNLSGRPEGFASFVYVMYIQTPGLIMMIMVLCRHVGLPTCPAQVLISSPFPFSFILTSPLCIFSQVLHFFSLLFFSVFPYRILDQINTLLSPTFVPSSGPPLPSASRGSCCWQCPKQGEDADGDGAPPNNCLPSRPPGRRAHRQPRQSA